MGGKEKASAKEALGVEIRWKTREEQQEEQHLSGRRTLG